MTAFEETLARMTTPEVPRLKHQALLADAISRGKSKSALSFWWMSIPLYVIAMLFMKSAYVRDSTLRSNLHEFFTRERYVAPLLFVVDLLRKRWAHRRERGSSARILCGSERRI